MTKSSVPGRDLSSKVKRSVNSGKQLPAKVIEVFFDKVRVQLSGNGQILNNLPVIGGPVDVGQDVKVDYSTTPPQAVAIGKTFATVEDLENALARAGSNAVTSKASISITLFSGGSAIDMFDPTSDGLQSAMIAANEGDVIWLPDTMISYDLEVKDGVTVAGVSSRESILLGNVTLGEGSVLENLKVVGVSSYIDVDTVTVTAVEKQAIIRNCEIHAYQCADGQAQAIALVSNALLDVSYSLIAAHSESGTGYCIEFASGSTVQAVHSQFWATTDWFTGTGTINEYANTEGFEESAIWCVPPIPAAYGYYGSYGIDSFGNPAGTDEKKGTIPLVPESLSLRTDASSYFYADKFQRMGNYLYYTVYVTSGQVWIREFNISTGAYSDLQVPGYSYLNGEFIVVEERKVLATSRQASSELTPITIYIRLLDFEANTVTTEHSFSGTTYTGVGHGDWWNYITYHPVITRNESGDLIVAVFGKAQFIDERHFGGSSYGADYKPGIYLVWKNWTDGGSWTFDSEYALASESVWHTDYQGDDYYTANYEAFTSFGVVGRRYLVVSAPITKSFTDHVGQYVREHGEFPPENDFGYIGFWIYDFDTGSFSYVYEQQLSTSDWREGITENYIGFDHNESTVYINTYPLRGDLDNYYESIWKIDAANATMGIHYTSTSESTDTPIAYNLSRCYFLFTADGTNYVVKNASDFSIVNPSLSSTRISKTIDWRMDDTNNYLWAGDGPNNSIVGINVETGDVESFEPDFTMPEGAYDNAKVVNFGEVFILRDVGSGPSYNFYWKMIRSA